MKAIILAAGMGTRLRPLTETLPKCLVPIDGKPLIVHSLHCLKEAGITEVLVVTGYLSERIEGTVGDSFEGIHVTYVNSEDYATTGSMHSLSQTKGSVGSSVLVLESDLLYEVQALREILKHPGKDVMLVAPCSGSGDEVYILADEEKTLTGLGKEIDNPEDAVGELVGICKLSPKFLEQMYTIADDEYNAGNRNHHYEEVIAMAAQELPVHCLVRDIAWIEIDKQADYDRAQAEVYPRILSAK